MEYYIQFFSYLNFLLETCFRQLPASDDDGNQDRLSRIQFYWQLIVASIQSHLSLCQTSLHAKP